MNEPPHPDPLPSGEREKHAPSASDQSALRRALLAPEHGAHDGGEREDGQDRADDEDQEVRAELHRPSSAADTAVVTSWKRNGFASTNFR